MKFRLFLALSLVIASNLNGMWQYARQLCQPMRNAWLNKMKPTPTKTLFAGGVTLAAPSTLTPEELAEIEQRKQTIEACINVKLYLSELDDTQKAQECRLQAYQEETELREATEEEHPVIRLDRLRTLSNKICPAQR